MEANPEIPKEMYGRWWKVINNEYGEIIDETANADSSTSYVNKNQTQSQEPMQGSSNIDVRETLTSYRDPRKDRNNSKTQDNLGSKMADDDIRPSVGEKLYHLT